MRPRRRSIHLFSIPLNSSPVQSIRSVWPGLYCSLSVDGFVAAGEGGERRRAGSKSKREMGSGGAAGTSVGGKSDRRALRGLSRATRQRLRAMVQVRPSAVSIRDSVSNDSVTFYLGLLHALDLSTLISLTSMRVVVLV